MNNKTRLEILETLSKGVISTDEALALLDQATAQIGVDLSSTSSEAIPVSDESESDIELLKKIQVEEYQPNSAKLTQKEQVIFEEPDYAPNRGGGKAHWLRIRVRDLESGRNRVSINLPLMFVSFGLRAAKHFNADMGEIEVDELMTLIKEGERGLLVDVQDEEDNEHVQIYLD